MAATPTLRPVAAKEESVWQHIGGFDCLLSAGAIIVLSPLILGVAIFTRALSGRSPVIAYRRVGQYGSGLWVYTFNTAWKQREQTPLIAAFFSIEHVDDGAGPDLKGPEDLRTGNNFAQFCRKQSLDELPQLVGSR